MNADAAQERWLRPGAEYAQHLDDEGAAPADGDGPSSRAADSDKSLNRQNFELGISRDYTVRTRFCVNSAHQGKTIAWRLW